MDFVRDNPGELVAEETFTHLLTFYIDVSCCVQQVEMTLYSFFVDNVEISDTLGKTLSEGKTWTSESVVEIVYQAQAVFRVRAVTRCTSSIEGHAEAVLTLQFSPNGRCSYRRSFLLRFLSADEIAFSELFFSAVNVMATEVKLVLFLRVV